VTGVVIDYTQNDRVLEPSIDVKDRRVIVSPLAPDGSVLEPIPQTKHRLQIGGVAYDIQQAKPFDPAGVDLFHDLRVRFP
jgi:hypothetical protein